MSVDERVLGGDEKAFLGLRALYRGYGYKRYRMSKFEEYDLYVKNKDFLVSNEIITFTDTTGKLLALKPDVTLSIIKNAAVQGGLQKLCYNENVYRLSRGSGEFREIMQTGLECVGDVGTYEICETLFLALKSLEKISDRFVLDISYMDLVTAFLVALGASDDVRSALLIFIGQKNVDGVRKLCFENGLEAGRLCDLIGSYGKIAEVLPKLKLLVSTEAQKKALSSFEVILNFLQKSGYADRVNIDFSIVNDMNYYNGVVFMGYLEGVPSGILSGGQYDQLMKKMGRSGSGIGFAVYLDQLQRVGEAEESLDADILLLQTEADDPGLVLKEAERLGRGGKSVLVCRTEPTSFRFGQYYYMTKEGAVQK